jgi:hypothetical protein
VFVGEIVDTHHPHLPGRVLVRWWPSADGERSEWLHHERHLTLARGDRVLVEIAAGPGGVDVRTEGDAITRARAIRLN